jgi:hypothetical protein
VEADRANRSSPEPAPRPADSHPAAATADASAAATRHADWLAHGIATELAGVLFLVHAIEDLQLCASFARLPDAESAGPWGALELIARALLPRRDASFANDAMWAVLAELSAWSSVECEPRTRRWAIRAALRVRRRVAQALDVDPRQPAACRHAVTAILRRPGHLFVTSSHVDVVMPLASADLDVRRAGLDRDPGWLPEYGRVIYFHYQ